MFFTKPCIFRYGLFTRWQGTAIEVVCNLISELGVRIIHPDPRAWRCGIVKQPAHVGIRFFKFQLCIGLYAAVDFIVPTVWIVIQNLFVVYQHPLTAVAVCDAAAIRRSHEPAEVAARARNVARGVAVFDATSGAP